MMSGTSPLAVVVLGVLATVPAGTSPQSSKPAWQWTTEERIALRTDPAAARERVSRGRSRTASNAVSAALIVDDIDGRTHPELFLPHELFRNLMTIAFLSSPRSQEAFRGAMQDDLERLHAPADFWQRLQALSTDHAARMAEHIALSLAPQSDENDVRRARIEECRSGAAALAAARREFGPELFDRFLYEAVARGSFMVSDELPDPQRMRQQAEGCE